MTTPAFSLLTMAAKSAGGFLAFLILLVPLALGCGFGRVIGPAPPPPPGANLAPTPEEAVRRSMLQGGNIQDVRPLGRRQFGDDVIVFYYVRRPATRNVPAFDEFIYGVAVRQGAGWVVRAGGGTTLSPAPADASVRYGLLSLPGERPPPAGEREERVLILGEVLRPEVAIVEAELANGAALRDDATSGAFVLLVPEPGVAACALRLLDAEETVLEEIDLPDC